MDVAALSLSVDSSDVVKAANDLDRFSTAAAKAAASAKAPTGSTAKMAQEYGRAAEKADRLSGAALRAAAANNAVASASGVAATAVGRQAAANDAAAASSVVATVAAGRQATANAAVAATATAAGSSSAAMGVAVAAGAAAGLVALGLLITALAAAAFGIIAFAGAFYSLKESVGKGTDALNLNEKQLDRLKKAGVDTSLTLKDAFAGLGYAIGTALKDALDGPLKGLADGVSKIWDDVVAFSSAALDTIVKVTIGTVAAIIAVWSDIPKVLTDLFYQAVNGVIEAYNAIVQAGWSFFYALVETVAGIPGAIGDAFLAGVQLAGSAFGLLLDWAKAAFTGLVYLWQNWPQILGNLFIEGVKAAFAAIVWLYEKSRDAIKALYDGGKALLTGSVGSVGNSAAGAAAGAADKATKAFNDAGTAYDKFKAKFAADFRKGALDARNTRLTTAAGSAGTTPKGGKTDAEKLADIYRNAQAEIAVQQDRLKAVGMSARAAAQMEEQTKLLNQVQKAGIPVTAAVTAEIGRLSKAYADAKIAADTAAAIQGVTDSLVKQRRDIADQVATIGLYGDALARARMEQEALNKARDALPRGEVLSPAAEAAIKADAGKTASAQAELDRQTRMEKVRKDAADPAYAMDLEHAGLGLTGAAAESYAYVTERLNEAKRAGIELSPAEIAAIKAAGDAYGSARYAIDQQKQAIADAREVTKGFFSEWINGVRSGENIFKSFADSVVSSLNKIIDKLLDKTLDNLVNGLFSGGGGGGSGGGFLNSLLGSLGLGSKGGGAAQSGGSQGPTFGGGSQGNAPGVLSFAALGDVYGAAQRFANGGAFTNRIFSDPTLFKFANGGKFGVMGEAGPEAVMPLTRGPNGKLGVQAHGGNGGGGGKPEIRMGDIHNTYKLDGAIGADGIAAMVRQGGEATYNQVKRDLQTLLAQLDTDGTFAS